MTTAAVLPRSLDPLPDECLPGYLLRLAHRLDQTPHRIAELLGLTTFTGVPPAEAALSLDATTKHRFATAAQLSPVEADALLLLNLTDRYLPLGTSLDGRDRRLRGIVQQEHWLFTRASRCCPDCLAGDGSPIQQRHGGPWTRRWRLPVVFACARHRRFLSHRCPTCRQPIFASTAAGLLPLSRAAGLHPAQCRGAPPGSTGQMTPCGGRLDTAGADISPPAAALAFQDKILDLLDPHGPATTQSVGHDVSPATYFTDLRLVTTLISASWPAHTDSFRHMPLHPVIDQFLHNRHGEITERRRHKSRPSEIVLHEYPPLPARECAGLLAAADHLLTLDDTEAATRHIHTMVDAAPVGLAWFRRITAIQHYVSPGLTTALQPVLLRFTPSPKASRRHSFLPTRRASFDHRHVPQRLPDTWFDRFFGQLPAGSRLLRRAAAIRLVLMVEGGTYAQAGHLLGLPDSMARGTFAQLNQWFKNSTNAQAFTAALNTLADELDVTTDLIDYGNRRRQLADWSIPPDDWRALVGDRYRPPPLPPGVPDWGERKRRFASWVAWTVMTSSEHLLAPGSILPPVRPGADNRFRTSFVFEWYIFHRRPWAHHAELRDIINRHVQRTIGALDHHKP